MGGALRAAAAWPLAVLYGLPGWLAGLHGEKKARRWTYPLVALGLVALLNILEGHLGVLLGGTRPPLSWQLATLAWHSLFCLAFLGMRR